MSSFPTLGDLEVAILEHVWTAKEVSAKTAHAEIGGERGISLNTVQSTLERLYRKDLLDRTKVGHSYRYSPRVTRHELVAALVRDVVGRFGGDSSAAIAAFVDAADIPDEQALQAIEETLRRRRGDRGDS